MVSQTAAPGIAINKLSSNDAIQFILADIPIFTVGILALGTLPFFFLMKRVDRWVLCLHISVLLSFLSSLLDLSQILLRRRSLTPFADDVPRIITAREVFYTFANSLRFLFYWGFVAMIPLGETIPEGINMHSGSWRRWGLTGRILKWSTLLLVLVMTILQLVYRDVPVLDQVGPAYKAEAALEIILSAIFILKLLFNTWARFPVGSTTPTKVKMMVQYIPAIIALLFSLWIAIGNLILFLFTDTALGRFMRAVELYILLVYMLTISFHHLRHLSFFPVYRPAPKRASQYSTYKRSSITKGDDLVQAANVSPPPPAVNLMQILEGRYRDAEEIPQTVERSSARSLRVESGNQHQSMAARLSTWLGMNRPLPNLPQGQQPWEVDAERGPSPVIQAVGQPWYTEENSNIHVESPSIPRRTFDEDEQRGPTHLPGATPQHYPEPDPEERQRVSSFASETQIYGLMEAISSEADRAPTPERDWEEPERSNVERYSGIGDDVPRDDSRGNSNQFRDSSSMNIEVVSPPSDEGSRPNSIAGSYIASPYPTSPVVSAAVTPIPRSRPLPPMPGRPTSMLNSPISPLPSDSARSSNMSILIRKQTELDKSIEALRFFSPSKQMFHVTTMPMPSANSQPPYAQREQDGDGGSPSLSVGSTAFIPLSPDPTLATPQVPESSVQSEFDFSQHQPPLNRSSMDSGVFPASLAAFQADRKLELRPDSPMNELIPPRMPHSRWSDSSSVGDPRERRVDSQGTQYDITSFVGNLTGPVNPKDSVQSTSSAMYSEDGFLGVATVTSQRVQRIVHPALIMQPPRLRKTESSSSSLTGLTMGPVIRRALLQPPSLSLQPEPDGLPTAPRFRRAVGLPARPRLSVVNLTPVEEKPFKTPNGSDTATLVSRNSDGSGTPTTGKVW